MSYCLREVKVCERDKFYGARNLPFFFVVWFMRFKLLRRFSAEKTFGWTDVFCNLVTYQCVFFFYDRVRVEINK